MKVKTSDLEGAALDWAVAQANGERPSTFIFAKTGKLAAKHNYSTDWSQGGPIIERELLAVYHMPGGVGGMWRAERPHAFMSSGPTPLIAAMRCYVASKMGDKVDVPATLVEG